MKRTIIFFLLCAGLHLSAAALIPDKVFYSQVHSLEHFIERINGDDIFPLVADSDSDKVRTTRFSLFDMDLLSDANTRDSILAMQVEFVDSLSASDVRVSMSDPQSWIEAYCVFVVNGQEVNLRLKMTLEEYGDGYWRWALSDLFDDENKLVTDIDHPLPINPLQHEFYFMSLDHFFEAYKEHLANSKSKNKRLDLLSYFLGMAASGKIKFDYCDRIVFHTLQVPGWELQAEQIDRIESSNSGWLITSISKTDK